MNNYKLPVNYTKLSPYTRRKVREQYMREQNGKCAHYGNNLSAQPTKEIRESQLRKTCFPVVSLITLFTYITTTKQE